MFNRVLLSSISKELETTFGNDAIIHSYRYDIILNAFGYNTRVLDSNALIPAP